jgi:hypothetical protein
MSPAAPAAPDVNHTQTPCVDELSQEGIFVNALTPVNDAAAHNKKNKARCKEEEQKRYRRALVPHLELVY